MKTLAEYRLTPSTPRTLYPRWILVVVTVSLQSTFMNLTLYKFKLHTS